MSDVKPVAWERFDELGVEYDSYVGLVEEGDYVKYDDALATVTALQAEVEALRTTDLQVYEQNTSLDLRCAELEKENEALRKDAERLDWLLPVVTGSDSAIANKRTIILAQCLMSGKDGVEAVDAAIAKERS